MTQLPASGSVAEQRFAGLIAQLAAVGFNGRLTLKRGAREYWIELNGGQIVDGLSPDPSDSIAKLALKAGLASKTQISAFVSAKRSRPHAKDAALLAEAANLSQEQMIKLDRLRVAQTAARLFALADATFEVTPGSPDERPGVITVEWVIFHGLRRYYTLERLSRELAPLGDKPLALSASAPENIANFAFEPDVHPILKALAQSANVQELATEFSERQLLLAALYALWATGNLTTDAPAAVHTETAQPALPVPQPKTETAPAERKKKLGSPPTIQDLSPPPPMTAATPAGVGANRKVKVKRARAGADEIKAAFDDRLAAYQADADHFELLGVERGCSGGELQKAYFKLARLLHPDRIYATGIDADPQVAQQLFARINKAFSVLSNPTKRNEYLEVLAAGGELAFRKQAEEAEKKAMNILAAEEHFLTGEMALRRNDFKVALEQFEKAVTLNPEEGEHHALYGWALWMSTADKTDVYEDVHAVLKHALKLSPKCIPATFYLGQLAVHKKDYLLARELFEKTLKKVPHHSDAQLQMRLLRSRGLI